MVKLKIKTWIFKDSLFEKYKISESHQSRFYLRNKNR